MGANVREANLRGADLRKAWLREADLTSADLSFANFSLAKVAYTIFNIVDLSTVKRLETVEHDDASIINMETINCSHGKIPEVFLLRAGVPEPFITQAKSLAGATEFSSCFISYSTNDQQFAEGLYTNLQANGVLCWFAPEDLKIGDEFRQRIDEAIHLHDKLLVVLSEASVQSKWVASEVEAAFERERASENDRVLFPIRLDDAVMQTKQAWAADMRRTRHIGDFRNWKNYHSYKRAFDRLLRDLKAEGKSKPVAQIGTQKSAPGMAGPHSSQFRKM